MTVQPETISPLEYFYQQVGFSAYPHQQEILDCTARFILVTGGYQSGKSITAKALAEKKVLEQPPGYGGLYWLVAEAYEQTRREFFYILEDFNGLGMVADASKRIDPGFIELVDGTRFETKSARDAPRALTMYAPDGIICCEASHLDYETFLLCQARVAPKRGWLFMSGTMEGSLGWYPSVRQTWETGMVPDSASFALATHKNTAFFPEGWDDPEILRLRREASDDWVNERLLGIPAPPKGLVIPEFRSSIHVKPIQWDPTKPTYIWVDPGYAGAHAVEAVQIMDNHVFVFDEIYENLITEDMISIAQRRPWWGADEDRPGVSRGVIDVAGYQHQAMAAPAEVWLDKGGIHMDAHPVRINEGTEVLRGYMKPDPITNQPKVLIDPKCKGLLSELGHCLSPLTNKQAVYRWRTDNDGAVVGNTPQDENNHAVKALIYGLVSEFGYSYVKERDKIKVRRWTTSRK